MASEIRVNKINSSSGVGTITLSPTGVDISGVTTVSTLKVGTGVTASEDGDIFFTGVCTATTFSGAHSGSGANLTNLPAANVTGTLPAISGANLTTLNASNIASGTVPDARFPATLPAASAANLTSIPAANITGTLPAISGANLTGISAGIEVAQQFRQTASQASNNETVIFDSNWAKINDSSVGSLGSFADPSSGIFTFPTTGIYLVTFTSYFEDSGYNTNAQIQIQGTANNSDYDTVSATHFGTQYDQSGNNYATGFVSTIIDVTDVTQVKVRFRAYSNSTVSWDGSSTQSRTAATFIRLGDT